MIRALALVLTVLTGFSGLVYEITWQKFLATLLGSHGEATAAVLAIFLGGLSVGYALFGRLTRRATERAKASGRHPRLLVLYGGVEAAIGVYAFAFPTLFGWASVISAAWPFSAPALVFAFDVGLATLLIGPPAVLMGATIPLLTQALARSLDDATGLHARVYAFNTAGAFFGALAAGFWLVPTLGLPGVIGLVGWLNVLVGVAFVAMGWRPRAVLSVGDDAHLPRVAGFAFYAAIAGLLGFAMMSIQVVFIRLGGLSLGSSHFTFAMVVAVFVLCIALGSMGVAAMSRIAATVIVANLWLLVGWLVLLYPVLGDGPYWAHALRSLFRDQMAGFLPFYANAFVGLLCVIGPPVMLSGAALPLLFHHLREQVGDLGALAGRLYSWNTVGSLVGALGGGYLLFYWLDLDAIYRVAIVALVIAAVVASMRVLAGRRGRAWAALALPSLVVLVWLPSWAPERLASGTFRFRQPQAGTYDGASAYFREHEALRVPFYDDDPAVSVAVVDHPLDSGGRSLAIVTNGKPDGSIGVDYMTMALAALLPAVLVDRIERGFVIGYGTGVTVGELAALESVAEVVVAEISSGVVEAAPLFDPYNLSASTNPKVRIARADAYRALQRSEGTFDTIISEPSNPWVTGTEMLYSREFLETARAHLAPGGVHVQWFHSYETDRETIRLVLNTFRSVFADVAVWYAGGPDFLIAGFPEPRGRIELRDVIARAREPDIAAGLARTGIEGLPELLAHELIPIGVLDTFDLGEDVHTLLHPILSDRAARAFFRGGQGSLPRSPHLRAQRASAESSLVAQYVARSGGALRPRAWARFAEETCEFRPRECAVVLARWLYDAPDSEARRDLLERSRQRAGYAPALAPYTQRALSQLFAPDIAEEGEVSVAQANLATESFSRFYHYSVPFERAALVSRWRACAQDPDLAETCANARASAERRLGDLQSEAAPVSTRARRDE